MPERRPQARDPAPPAPGAAALRDMLVHVRESLFGDLPGLPESQLTRAQRALINTTIERHLRVQHVRRLVRYKHVRSNNISASRSLEGPQEWRNDYWLCDGVPEDLGVAAGHEDAAAAVYEDLGDFMAHRRGPATFL